LNILQVTLGFYPATAWGGPVKIVQQNSRELTRRGHAITIYCTNLLDKQRVIHRGTFEAQLDGLRVVYFRTWHWRGWPGTLGPIWLPDLPAWLRREIDRFDLVHLNGYRNFLNLPVAAAARRAGVPFVVQPHGALPVIVNSFFAKRLYDRLLGRRELNDLSWLIAGQESERRQALAAGVPIERIALVPNGLDSSEAIQLPAQGSFRAKYGIPADVPLILFLGRINKKKGTDLLVESFECLRIPDARLVIAGPDDGLLTEVLALIERYGLGQRVVLTGLLQAEEVTTAYQDADLFVLPCRTDTFPMAIIEACHHGLPMVITEGCEIAYMVKDKVADVVPFDPQLFAAAMEALLKDREKYIRYKKNCATLSEKLFSIKTTVDRLEELYQTAIAEYDLKKSH